MDVQDGLAYLSYWNDNLLILDVGNGIKGGTPANPQIVSQYKCDLNKLYQKVEDLAGAVVDVSDLEHPRAVAWFEPDQGGVHNIWVAGDTLYMGAYQRRLFRVRRVR